MKTNFLHFKKSWVTLLIISLFIGISNNVRANHFVGGDLSYQCTNTAGVYKVQIKYYSDCAGAPMCPGCTQTIPNGTVSGCTTTNAGINATIIGASAACLGLSFGSFTLNAVAATSGYDIIQTCSSLQTICTNCNTRTAGTFSPGIEVYTFEGNVDLSNLPSTCCKVTLSANGCCRNSALTTIVPANFAIVWELDRCQTACNSAPTFTNDAIALVCAGQDFIYNLGAIDPDGDSLSYAFGSALQGVGTPVNYVAPYSANYPFSYFGAPNTHATWPAGLHIDPITGDIMFRPFGIFVSELVIEVTQWKLLAGIWVNVGKTSRDVQFQTTLCLNNLPPQIKVYKDGILQYPDPFKAFAGQQICLDLVCKDQEALTNTQPILADTTELKWNNPGLYVPVMDNATFTRNYILSQRGINGPKADSFKFCWTPPIWAVRTLPYLFTVTGSDRYCPIKSLITKGIAIIVEAPITIFIDSITKNTFCNNKINTTNVSYRTNKMVIFSGNVFTVQLSDSLGSFVNASVIGYKSTNDTIGVISVTFPQGLKLNKQYKIRVYSTSDALNIGTPFAINIIAGFNVPLITTNKDSLCEGKIATFKVKPNTAGLTFKWLKNDVLIANQTKDSLLVDSAFTYRAIVTNTGCSDTSNAKYLTVFPYPKVGFTINNPSQCVNGNSFVFTDTSKIVSGSTSRLWTLNNTDTSTSIIANKSFNNAGSYVIKLLAISIGNCKDSMTTNVTVNNNATANFNIINAAQCLTGNNFSFTNTSTNSNAQTWNFGDASNSTALNPTKTYINAGSYNVKLLAKNAVNCNDSITKTVVVNPQPVAAFTVNNANQCLNGNNFLFTDNSSIATGTLNRLWLFDNTNTSTNIMVNKTFTTLGTHNIKLTVKSGNNCLDTTSKTVTVLPKVNIGTILGNAAPNSITTPYAYSVLNQPNVVYNWTAINGTIQSGQGTNAVSVVWTSAGSGKIKAEISNTSNCTDTTTLPVNITTVGINNLSLDNDLKVYPNPTKNNITITNKTNLVGKKYIITNLVGQTVITGKLNLDETIVNLETLQSGIYLLSIDGMNKQSIKVIKE